MSSENNSASYQAVHEEVTGHENTTRCEKLSCTLNGCHDRNIHGITMI